MAQQPLDDANVGAGLEQVRGEVVPQRMSGDALGDAALCVVPGSGSDLQLWSMACAAGSINRRPGRHTAHVFSAST